MKYIKSCQYDKNCFCCIYATKAILFVRYKPILAGKSPQYISTRRTNSCGNFPFEAVPTIHLYGRLGLANSSLVPILSTTFDPLFHTNADTFCSNCPDRV